MHTIVYVVSTAHRLLLNSVHLLIKLYTVPCICTYVMPVDIYTFAIHTLTGRGAYGQNGGVFKFSPSARIYVQSVWDAERRKPPPLQSIFLCLEPGADIFSVNRIRRGGSQSREEKESCWADKSGELGASLPYVSILPLLYIIRIRVRKAWAIVALVGWCCILNLSAGRDQPWKLVENGPRSVYKSRPDKGFN